MIGPKSIRGKVTLAATMATALAMAMVVAITSYAMQQILTGTISNSLDERLDQAQELVRAGNYQAAIDLAGLEMMQIIDENGNILAETPNARGLAAIVIDDDDDDDADDNIVNKRVAKLSFERESDDDDDDADERRAAGQSTSTQSTSGSKTTGSTQKETATQQNASSGSGNASTNGSTGSNASGAQGQRPASNNSAPAATNTARPSDDDDDDDDDDDADDDVDDTDDDWVAPAPQQTQPAAQPQPIDDPDDVDDADDVDDVDDDADDTDDDVYVAPAPAPAPVATADDYDDDGDDDSDAEEVDDTSDDDDDDDDDDGRHRASKSIEFPFSLVATLSSASAPSTETKSAGSVASAGKAYVDASDVFGDAGPYLVKKRQVDSPDGPVTLAAIASIASATQTASLTTQLLVTIFLALLCLVIGFTWNMAARTLQPVEQMRSTAESITTSDLSARIPVPEQDKDLSRLAQTFNDLLARVEAAFVQQRRFVSDASHELKSPVAATGIMLETLRNHPEAVDTTQVVEDLTTENDRLSNIVGDLLMLARSDENRMQVDAKPIDLMDLLLEEVATLGSRSSITVDTSAIEPLVCQADPELLSHVVRNLLDNAARYARTVVKVSCTQQDGQVLVRVSDDGPGIAPEDREHVFDRFVCLEDSRSNPNGTGLGLPVARSIAERHGGTLVFTDPEIGGATALLRIPLL